MKLTLFITKELGLREGISKQTGMAWKTASYVGSVVGSPEVEMVVFDVKDGMAGRIDRLNLKPGKTYEVWIAFKANNNGDRWFNNIVCTDAREILPQDETTE